MRPRQLRLLGPAILAGLVVSACTTAPRVPMPNETDLEVLARVTQRVLEDNRTGEGRNWQNPETGHHGSVVVLGTIEDDGAPCREYQQTFTADSRIRVAFGFACRGDAGQWSTRRHTGFMTLDRRRYADGRYWYGPYWPYDRRHRYDWPYYWRDDRPWWPHHRLGLWYGYAF